MMIFPRPVAAFFLMLLSLSGAALDRPMAQDSGNFPVQPLNALSNIDASSLSGFRDRPLFSPTRHAPIDSATVSAPVAITAPPVSNIRLVGVIKTPDGSVAHIVDVDTGSRYALRAGDAFRDGRVVSIDVSSLTVSRNEVITTYRIFARSPLNTTAVIASQSAVSADKPEDARSVRMIELPTRPSAGVPVETQSAADKPTQEQIDVFGAAAKP